MNAMHPREGALVIDTVPKRCPFVLLGLKKGLLGAEAGQLVAVRTIDPQAVDDIRRYCLASALPFEGSGAVDDGVLFIYVRKSAVSAAAGSP